MITINPILLDVPAKELKAWIALMTKENPETDWAKLIEELKAANPDVKGIGGKGKED